MLEQRGICQMLKSFLIDVLMTDENPDKVDALTQLPDIRDVNVDIMLAGL